MALLTLDNAIRNVVIEPAYDWNKYDLYLQYAIRGLRQLNYIGNTPKTKYLELDAVNVAKLPDDFVRLSKLGVVIEGRINVLTVDNSIVSPKERTWTCDGGLTGQATPPQNDVTSYQPGFYFRNFTHPTSGMPGKLFGYGIDNSMFGSFRIDHENWQIQFTSDVGGEGDVVLEYMSNGLAEVGKDTYFDERALEAVIAFIKWKSQEGIGDKARLGERDYWKKQWFDNKWRYLTSTRTISFQDLEWISASGYQQAPQTP
jgi:hypothetical protein